MNYSQMNESNKEFVRSKWPDIDLEEMTRLADDRVCMLATANLMLRSELKRAGIVNPVEELVVLAQASFNERVSK